MLCRSECAPSQPAWWQGCKAGEGDVRKLGCTYSWWLAKRHIPWLCTSVHGDCTSPWLCEWAESAACLWLGVKEGVGLVVHFPLEDFAKRNTPSPWPCDRVSYLQKKKKREHPLLYHWSDDARRQAFSCVLHTRVLLMFIRRNTLLNCRMTTGKPPCIECRERIEHIEGFASQS